MLNYKVQRVPVLLGLLLIIAAGYVYFMRGIPRRAALESRESAVPTAAVSAAIGGVAVSEGDLRERLGEDWGNPSLRLDVGTFSPEEYGALVDSAMAGDQLALAALRASILRYLPKHPNDGKYAALKRRLYSREFILSVPFAQIRDLLPAGLLRLDRELALAILAADSANFAYFPRGLRGDKEMVRAAVSGDLSMLRMLPDDAFDDGIVELCAEGPEFFKYIPERLKYDKKFIRSLLVKCPKLYYHAWSDLRDGPEVLQAVKDMLLATTAQFRVPEQLCDDPGFVRNFLENNPDGLAQLPQSTRCDRGLMGAFMKKRPDLFHDICAKLQCDPDFFPLIREEILKSPAKYSSSLPSGLCGNREFAEELLSLSPGSMVHLSAELKADKALLLPVIRAHPEVYFFAGESVQNDADVLPIIRDFLVNSDWRYYDKPPDKLRGDREVILSMVRRNCHALKFAEEKLRDDDELVRVAVANSQDCLKYASDRLRKELFATGGAEGE